MNKNMVGVQQQSKRRARTAGAAPRLRDGPSASGYCEFKMIKSDVRFGNKEGGGTHFGSAERFAYRTQYVSDAMYTIPAAKAPPFSFGTSTRADWEKMLENTKDLHNPNGEKLRKQTLRGVGCTILWGGLIDGA